MVTHFQIVAHFGLTKCRMPEHIYVNTLEALSAAENLQKTCSVSGSRYSVEGVSVGEDGTEKRWPVE